MVGVLDLPGWIKAHCRSHFHLHTHSGCDKAISVTVLLCASGRYGKVKCIWRREATIWSRSPSSCKHQNLFPSSCPFPSPRNLDLRNILSARVSAGRKCWLNLEYEHTAAIPLTVTVSVCLIQGFDTNIFRSKLLTDVSLCQIPNPFTSQK